MSRPNLTGIILTGGKSTRFKSPKYLATINGKTLLEIAISKLEPLCQEIIVVGKEPIERQEARPARQCQISQLALAGGGERRESWGQSPIERKGDSPQKQSVSDVALYDRGHPFEKGVSPRSVIEQDKHFHPLIGIKEGLNASHNEANVVLACDMPFVSRKMIIDLFPSVSPFSKGGLRGIFEIRLYRYQGRIEPLLGFYRKSCLGKIASHLIHQSPITNPARPAGGHQSRQNPRIIDALTKCNIDYIDVNKDCLDFFNINTKEDLIDAQKIAQRNQKLLGN